MAETRVGDYVLRAYASGRWELLQGWPEQRVTQGRADGGRRRTKGTQEQE